MKRSLTEKEIDICNKQINRLESEWFNLKDVKEYAKKKLEMLEVQWKFEDFAKPLERKQTRDNSKKTIENADNEMKELKEKISDLKEQIKNGVNTPTGV